MSLYKIVLAANPLALFLLTQLNIPVGYFTHILDTALVEGEGDDLEIMIIVRASGGYLQEHIEDNDKLRRNDLFLRDREDEFDPTFGLFFFRLPYGLLDDLRKVGGFEHTVEKRSIRQRLEETKETLNRNTEKIDSEEN